MIVFFSISKMTYPCEELMFLCSCIGLLFCALVLFVPYGFIILLFFITILIIIYKSGIIDLSKSETLEINELDDKTIQEILKFCDNPKKLYNRITIDRCKHSILKTLQNELSYRYEIDMAYLQQNPGDIVFKSGKYLFKFDAFPYIFD